MSLCHGRESGEWIHFGGGDAFHPCIPLHRRLDDERGFGLLQESRCESSRSLAVSESGDGAGLLGAWRWLNSGIRFSGEFSPKAHGGSHTRMDFCQVVAIVFQLSAKKFLLQGR